MQKVTPRDLFFMKEALRLAEIGKGRVHPNPLVGAVLVKKNRIIGKGAHRRFGGPHAEREAILHAKASPKGSTLYVTLEPCAHFGKTPPCADLILKHGIRKVVVAAADPNPLVSGKGVRRLKRQGIVVVRGVLTKEAEALNEDYNYWMRKKIPYVVAKIAQSLDGKIATRQGQSRWITDERARRFSHTLRASADAILVGVNTVLKDDPLLSVRTPRATSQPVKVILDSRLRLSPRARIFSSRSKGPVILAVTKNALPHKRNKFQRKAEILVIKERGGQVDLLSLLRALGKKGIVKVLIEGGGEVLASAFAAGVVKELYVFIAPKIIGGRHSVPAVAGEGVRFIKDATKVHACKISLIGKDLLIHGRL